MGYLEEPLHVYLDALASGKPTPGGGSAAALVGVLGAALNSMVINFTVGRPKYAAVEAEMQEWLASSEALRAELQQLVQEDTVAYGTVSAAYKLPRETPEEQAARTAAIQEALKTAAQVPLAAARACHQVLCIASAIVDKGNPNLITDVGVAAKFALAALECAVLNVEINLLSMTDTTYVNAVTNELRPLVHECEVKGREVWEKVIKTVRKAR